MGPHGVDIAVISGQKNGGELVIAASLFLQMQYLSITPVSPNKNAREEFLLSLSIFSYREYAYNSSPYDQWFIQKITEPNDRLATTSLFWLALDEQGYSAAREALSANGLFPDQHIYQSIRKLNRMDHDIPSYPQAQTPPEFWRRIQSDLYRVAWEHRRVKSLKGRRKLFNEHLPVSSVEKDYYSWFQSLHDDLVPWKEMIYNIQSDWS